MMKKIFVLITAIVLCFSFTVSAAALDSLSEGRELQNGYPSDSQRESIIISLRHTENIKQTMGLDNVPFSEIYVGEALRTYDYTYAGFEESGIVFPLFYQNTLVAVAREMDNGHFQITTALAERIQELRALEAAIIYDVNSCYLFDGTDFLLLQETDTEILSRNSISDSMSRSIIDTSELDLCDLSASTLLGYGDVAPLSTSTYVECPDVEYVSQDPPSNLCWAATIACIKNAVSGTSLTAVDVAKEKYGNSNYDKTIKNNQIASFMKGSYNLSYTLKSSVPSDKVIKKNMNNEYPIFGIFSWVSSSRSTTKSYHDGTIYGIDTSDKYIAVMDPEFGATISYKDGSKYTYISEWSGVTLTFAQALCKSW